MKLKRCFYWILLCIFFIGPQCFILSHSKEGCPPVRYDAAAHLNKLIRDGKRKVSSRAQRSMVSEKFLVTGGTGFVGSHIVRMLNRNGIVPKVLTRFNSDISSLDGLEYIQVSGDITYLHTLHSAFQDMEVVIHLAAKVSDYGSPEDFKQVNFQGTKNVMEASLAAQVKRVIHFSTVDVFGVEKNGSFNDESLYSQSRFDYPDTKIEAEAIALFYHHTYALPVSVIRPTWIYGPGDKTFVPKLVDALRHRIPVYFGSQDNRLGIVYVENLANAVWHIISNKETVGKSYIVNDENIAWGRFVNQITQDLSLKPPLFTLPVNMAQFIARWMERIWKILKIKSRPPLTPYVVSFMGSNMEYKDTAIKKLGYSPLVSTEDGVAHTVDWLQTQDLKSLKKK
jgi:2-alkyl-3-oxoalkanoate reductase